MPSGFRVEQVRLSSIYWCCLIFVEKVSMDTNNYEIDEGTGYVGYREAFNLIALNVKPVGVEEISLASCAGRIASGDVTALISYPSVDVSLKDGFAVQSDDVVAASPNSPVDLRVIGSVYAGSSFDGEVRRGTSVKICSGAPIPRGADAVLSDEFCEEVSADSVRARADAEKGRNILRAGAEVRAGATIVAKGDELLPGYLGMAAAAGISHIGVFRRPKVAVVGVGDEVVAPGERLSIGQLYASNLVTMAAWLASFDIPCVTAVVNDNEKDIMQKLRDCVSGADVILTSGGAWGSERDLVVGTLDKVGWREIFHHVRMGPGKGIAFGIWENRPVFCLPGGPASNEMAFLQLALPGLLRMAGDARHPLRTLSARLTEDLTARHPAWTEFKDATLSRGPDGNYNVAMYRHRSRLQAIASANTLICIPEGAESLKAGDVITVQVLIPRLDDNA
jgi:molybdopterin molybdotransferase